jgi:glycosyltransferase involved in cell wall biosynthesis
MPEDLSSTADSKPKADPDVSVVVPFFNQRHFLQETIQSVFDQSYTRWELLLCDDGSSDDSTAIALRYASQHPGRVFYFEHPDHANRGASAARNLGIRHARGKFVALLDADDVWLPWKLRDQVRLLDAHPEAGMLYGNTLYWYSWTGNASHSALDHQKKLGVPVNRLSHAPQILIQYLDGSAAVPCTCSVLARRNVVERVGGFEEVFRGMYDDQAFYAKMLLTAPVFVSNSVSDKYRIHPDSMCAVAERKREVVAAHLRYLDWLEGYFKEQGVAHRALWRALQENRWHTRHPHIARLHRGLRSRVRAAVHVARAHPHH